MKKIKNIDLNKVKDFIIRRKYIFIIVLVLLILLVILISISNSGTSTITYKEIKNMMEEKETFIVYYYNSKSSNKYNRKIKNLLEDNDINYYLYDDKKVDKEEYNNFTSLLGIDKNLFGTPAIIYIKDGEMYSNLININNIDSYNKYIEDYDLVTVK